MPRITYVNGQYQHHRDAMVHVEDRGYQLADGVYEVIAIYNGTLIDNGDHMDRLERSLSELSMAWPVGRRALVAIMAETIRRNYVRFGKLYLQITRGVARRDHAFPAATKSSLVVTASSLRWPSREQAKTGQQVITLPDIRWQRRDIKSVSLLPNVLAKQAAVEAGAGEAWMVDADGFVTEGTASNAWIVTKDGELVTRPTTEDILAGITRKTLLRLIAEQKLTLVERPFTVDEAKQAKEAFFTSTTALLRPAVQIDDAVIGNGEPGEISCRLIDGYYDYMERGIGRRMTLNLPYPKAVIFDWDDTLVNGWPAIHAATNATLTHFGLEAWSYEKTRANVRRSMRDSFPELFGDRWEEAAKFFYAAIRSSHLDSLEPLDGADALLRKLSTEGLYLGVVSNKNGDLLRNEADHLGWSGYFAKVIGATDAERDKPDPAPLHMALSGLDQQTGPEIWFVGDAVSDMECAKRGGVAVLVGEKDPDSDEFSAFKPDFAVKNAIELAEYLDSAKQAVHM